MDGVEEPSPPYVVQYLYTFHIVVEESNFSTCCLFESIMGWDQHWRHKILRRAFDVVVVKYPPWYRLENHFHQSTFVFHRFFTSEPFLGRLALELGAIR